MSLNNPYPGANLLAEWQATSWPWLTASSIPAGGANVTTGYVFSTVAKHFRFTNLDSGSVKVGFTANGVANSNYYLVPTSGSLELDVKFTRFFILGNTGQQFNLFVGLTGIPFMQLGALTGSNGPNGLNIG